MATKQKTGSVNKTIALVFDFDDTLADDSTSAFVESLGISASNEFWPKRVQPLLRDGWDPMPAQFYALVSESKRRDGHDKITRERLAKFGRELPLYKNVENAFDRLIEVARQANSDVTLEFYLLSSGIGEIIRNTAIAPRFKWMRACEFHYGSRGEIDFPRLFVSHTEKTRFLHRISLGCLEDDGEAKFYSLMRARDDDRRVPFRQFIYVGDGFTDVPCFSLVTKGGGVAIGVYKESTREKWGEYAGFNEDSRVHNLANADYSNGSELLESLELAVESQCKLIELREKSYGE